MLVEPASSVSNDVFFPVVANFLSMMQCPSILHGLQVGSQSRNIFARDLAVALLARGSKFQTSSRNESSAQTEVRCDRVTCASVTSAALLLYIGQLNF